MREQNKALLEEREKAEQERDSLEAQVLVYDCRFCVRARDETPWTSECVRS